MPKFSSYTSLLTLIIFISLNSCKKNIVEESFYIEGLALEQNYSDWWKYYNDNIELYGKFTGLDTNSVEIEKGTFLKALNSGKYIPLKLENSDSFVRYRLFKLSREADLEISEVIKMMSKLEYDYYIQEGKAFPDFNFIDLNGKSWTKNELQGKTIVLKCWFINCKPCIRELPKLNKLVQIQDNIKDTIFLSLALDSKEDLLEFKNNNPIEYLIIPDQRDFIEKKLKVSLFPSHYVIDSSGNINTIVTRVDDLISALGLSMKFETEDAPHAPAPPL